MRVIALMVCSIVMMFLAAEIWFGDHRMDRFDQGLSMFGMGAIISLHALDVLVRKC